MSSLGNLTDMDIMSIDVFNAPVGGQQSYIGSFDSNGNYTGQGYGSNLPGLPLFPSSSGSAASATNSAPAASGTSVASPNNPLQFTTPSSGTSSASSATSPGGSIADYFIRGVIIILGFIFVAVGLKMFSGPSVILQK